MDGAHLRVRIDSPHFGPDVEGWDAELLASGLFIVNLLPGDLIRNMGLFVPTAFDGTTPSGDLSVTGAMDGFFDSWDAPIDLGNPDTTASLPEAGMTAQSYQLATKIGNNQGLPIRVTFPIHLFVVASRDGKPGGTALDSTVGEAWAWVEVERVQRG